VKDMVTSFFRVIKYAVQNFIRNFWLSFVTLTILFLALATVHILLILNLLADTAINQVEEKIDVTVYFQPEIKEEQILNVRNHLESLREVKDVVYISREDALIDFRAKHQDNEKILETLDELEENPLGATLVVSAEDTEEYQEIIKTLESPQYASLIEDKDFDDHRLVIERITMVTDQVSFAVTVMAIIFVLISILIVFNSIRVAIYTHRDEIKVMSLVGATHSFVVGPYIVEAILFALVAVLISMMVTYPFLGIIQPYVETFFEGNGFNLVQYYNQNFVRIFGGMFVGTSVITSSASLLAVKKYIKY
jgi:cell division transport system permease protein